MVGSRGSDVSLPGLLTEPHVFELLVYMPEITREGATGLPALMDGRIPDREARHGRQHVGAT